MTTENDICEILSPYKPVIHPSVGAQLQGSGAPLTHQLVWSDANPVFYADALFLQSKDPSALCHITVGGTATVGDVITLNFTYLSVTHTVTYTVQTGNTISDVVDGIKLAIEANTSLFTAPVGGLPGQILVLNKVGNILYFDYNVANTMTITSGVSGAATETITIPSPIPTALDANPIVCIARYPTGIVPSAGSNCGQAGFFGNTSGGGSTAYSLLSCTVNNSTQGTLSSSLLISPVNESAGCGLYVDTGGVYTVGASGGKKGTDTINAAGLYVNGTNISSLYMSTSPTQHALTLTPKFGGANVGMTGTFGGIYYDTGYSYKGFGSLIFTNKGSSTGGMDILTNLPSSLASGQYGGITIGYYEGLPTSYTPQFRGEGATTNITPAKSGASTSTIQLTDADITNSTKFYFCFEFFK